MSVMTHSVRTLVTTRDDGRFLRLALRLDAATSGACGVVSLIAAPALADLLGPGTGWLRAVGAFMVAYAAALVLLSGLRSIPRPAGWTVVIGNLVWAVGTGVLAFAVHELTTLGAVVVLAQAAAVLMFADLQAVGLRRAR